MYELVLVPGTRAQSHSPTLPGLCECNCCLGQLPHIHAVVTRTTLSLASSVDIFPSSIDDNNDDGDDGEIIFSRQQDYIVGMSRVDDVMTRMTRRRAEAAAGRTSASGGDGVRDRDTDMYTRQGPVYRIESISD